MTMLHLSTRRYEGTVTVTVAGELDIATAPDLKSYMHKILLAGPGRVVINLSEVSFVGAAGLGTFVALRVLAERQHTALLLAGVPASMLRLMRLTRLDDQFDYLTVTEGGHGAEQTGSLGEGVDPEKDEAGLSQAPVSMMGRMMRRRNHRAPHGMAEVAAPVNGDQAAV
jgi:anti-sigma B factor antagonist